MKIISFDTDKGFYLTQLESLETELHSHPAIEIVFSDTGKFNVQNNKKNYSDISLVIIDSNILHKVNGNGVNMSIFIVENKDNSVRKILLQNGITLTDGIYCETQRDKEIPIQRIINEIINTSNSHGYDARVLKAIAYMDNMDISYNKLIEALLNTTNLSESRLSHLFKNNTGVSLKKYFVWSKLKKAVTSHIQGDADLLSSIIQSGFYDQAHFSKSYKAMIGISPSKVYKKSME